MAWTGNFKDQIDDLSGVITVTDNDAIQQWILDGCYDIIDKAIAKNGSEEMWKFVIKSGAITVVDTDVDEIRTVTGVVRDGVLATRGVWGLKSKYADTNSIYKAVDTTPVWYLDNNTIVINPAPTGDEPANYYYVPEYALTSWNSSISSINNFPSEYYYHAMLYAAIQVLHRRMLDSTTSTSPTFEPLPTSPETISDVTLVYDIALANIISTIDVDSYSSAPIYTAPTTSLSALESFASFVGTLANLQITAIAPTVISNPVISSSGVATVATANIITNVPAYTKPDTLITAVVPDSPTLSEISFITPSLLDTFTSGVTIPSATITAPNITAEDVSTLAKPDISGDIPFYNLDNTIVDFGTGAGQQFADLAAKTITDLNVTSVVPDTPEIDVVSYIPASTITVTSTDDIASTGSVTVTSISAASSGSDQPAYEAPPIMGIGLFLSEMESGIIGSSASDIDFEHWFSVAGQYIGVEEDVELANAQIQKISTYINVYQTDIQNKLNTFNKDVQIYQQLIQQDTQNANATNQAALNDIQREMQENQSNQQRDVQENQTKISS
jgi:hypothetical protein